MKADILIRGEAIFDSLSDQPFPGYVAIRGNRILAVGPPEKETDFIDKDTKILDAKDGLVMAGFHDAHTHLLLAGMYKACVNLGKARSEEESVELLHQFEQQHPTEGWIFGFNWYHVFWDKRVLPTKHSLDRYFPDRPVFLVNAEAHGAWVNSKALEIAGITKDTPDPFGGTIERLENGEPSGFLEESAVAFVGKHCLNLPPEREKAFLKGFMDDVCSLGITSLIDVQPYFGANMGDLQTYLDMEKNDELSLRIHVASNLFGDLEQAAEKAKECTGTKVRANLVKQFVDGVFVNHTALVLEEYLDAPGNLGAQLSELEPMAEAIVKAHGLGLSIKLHALGDRAVQFALDSIEKAVQIHGRNQARHALEHIELIAEEDILRMKQLEVIPSVQPEHLGLNPRWEDEEYRFVLGEERAARTWSFKSLLEATGLLALGSDCPVVDNNPFYGIHRGLTRLHDDGLPEGGWNPGEKLTLPQLLKGYTIDPAYSVNREFELGSLQTGKLADVIILDRDLFQVSPEEIRDTKVMTTVFDGKIIYQKDK